MPLLANIFNPEAMIIVLVVVLVLFGGSKIPELMKGLGSGMREFKKGMNEDEPRAPSEDREAVERRIREEVEAEMRNRK